MQPKEAYQETGRGTWGRIQIHGPVHDRRRPPYGEDDGVHVVHRHGLDAHGPRARLPLGIHVIVSFGPFRLLVHLLGILCR